MSDDHSLLHLFTKAFWDERYAGSDRIWSGNPNPRLVEHVADLAPSTALDVGCGEGADVVWLARQGWRVTGVDVSDVALKRAQAHAHEAGYGMQTAFEQVDVVAGEPLPGPVDLVTAQFFHAPRSAFATVIASLEAAVNPDGLLLVVGHHPDDQHTGLRNPDLASLLFTPADVVDALTPGTWEVRVAEAATRVQHVTASEDAPARDVTVTDTVVLALRTSGT